MSDIVVMIGRRIDCEQCSGTGLVAHGFMVGPRGPICPDCKGGLYTQETMTLEGFASLFEVHYTPAGPFKVTPRQGVDK